MKRWGKILALVAVAMMVVSVAAIAAPKQWVVGFSQIGSESEWRTADTHSVQDAFAQDDSFALMYADAQQKQENQIKALRSFVARKVDCIVFTALVETGYGPVLAEAQKAKIPVVMIDRDVAKADQMYRLTIMGSDFIKEGEKVGLWLEKYLKDQGIDDGTTPIDFAEIQGTTGSAPAIERAQGFRNIQKNHPNWKINHSQDGDFTSTQGKAVMEAFLKADPKIQVLFAHNDQEALGAIQAIKEAGLQPGKDITIISIDGVKGIFQAIVNGEANCTVECNPLLGPQAVQAVRDLRDGKKLPARIWTIEGIFDASNAATALPSRQY
ncbi:MAG: ABC transporter substrate-binding protein [Spirochaetia bacterium]|jgi:simple sugar transport system substrate-binding protein